jgi:putative transposase
MLSLENGLRKEQLNVLESEHIEDIILKKSSQKEDCQKIKVEKSVTQEYPQTVKKRIWKNKSDISKTDSQNTRSLRTLEVVLTLRGKDLKPFWNQQSREISQKLWLPIEIDCVDLDSNSLNGSLPVLKGKSWFSTKRLIPRKKNLLKTSSQSSQCSPLEFTDSENIRTKLENKLKCLRIPLLPTREQKEKLIQVRNQQAWFYNASIDILNKDDNMKKCSYIGELSGQKLRDVIRKYKYVEEKIDNFTFMDFEYDEDQTSFPIPDYLDQVHNRVIRGGIMSLVNAVKAAESNKKNGNIKSYHLKYKTKKDKKYTIYLEDKSYPKWINKIQGSYSYKRKRIPLSDLLEQIPIKNMIISLDRETDKYFMYLPVDATFIPSGCENQTNQMSNRKHDYISLDTGIRTFQTGFSDDHIVQIGDGNSTRLSDILKQIDVIQRDMNTCMCNRKRKRLRKRKLCLYYRLKCLVDDIHWKTCNFLVSNYKFIMMCDFAISGMVKKNNLSKMTKRLMYIYSFYKFKERLKYKAEVNGIPLCYVDESWTSKTCSCCGEINNTLGTSKSFKCHDCNFICDRDVNGARNILIKNWEIYRPSL